MGQIAGGRAYNAREVYVVLGGQPITGFADGDFVGFTPSADDSAMVVGSTGDVGLAALNDRTGVFVFGLLHGLGFAGVLTGLQLPRADFAVGLLGFNLGVEAGQLTVIAGAALVVGWWRQRPWYHRRIVVPASLAIAAFAGFLIGLMAPALWRPRRTWPRPVAASASVEDPAQTEAAHPRRSA